MYPVRYIHAADLHLDAAFKGLAREITPHMPDLAARLHSAAFTALERLFALCEREKVDFLVIAGDIYNAEDHSLKAQLALRDGCERLAAHGIKVFLAHGNRDPLASRLLTLDWPGNVVIFGDKAESHVLEHDGVPYAVVHGISHAAENEGRNLARSFKRLDSDEELKNCFQLGVLHCDLYSAPEEKNAPCTLEDLAASGLDAWALGHIHDKRVVSPADPFVAYSGNIQGLHINEPGPRGCMLTTVNKRSGVFVCEAHFQALAAVQWVTLSPDISGLKSVGELEAGIGEAMDFAGRQTGPECHMLIARVVLGGRSRLNEELRVPGVLAELSERLYEHALGKPAVLLKDIVLKTRPLSDIDVMLKRDDLLGETMRLADSLSRSPEDLRAMAEQSLEALYKHPRLRKLLDMPDEAEAAALVDEARQVCIDLMEVN